MKKEKSLQGIETKQTKTQYSKIDLFANSSETTPDPSEGGELFASLGGVFLFPSFGGGRGG
jgi:hypothetical protein